VELDTIQLGSKVSVTRGPKSPGDSNAPPKEVVSVTPRELHPVADIRFVMIELGKLTAQVERLIGDVNILVGKLDSNLEASSARFATVQEKLTTLDHRVDGIHEKQTEKVPFWKRMDPANILLAAVGVITLIMTLTLGNGRFDDMNKRLDRAEGRMDKLEEHVGTKLDQISTDVATLKARPTAPNATSPAN
jgi:hypothetical protein